MTKLSILRGGDYPGLWGVINVITRVHNSRRSQAVGVAQKWGHEPRDVGDLYKLQKAR
jgi:hypothetical protein